MNASRLGARADAKERLLRPGLSYRQAAVLFVGGLTLARLIYAWPLDLWPDDAYHTMLGQRPAFGYFDHPPLLMWLLGASTRVLGLNETAVRLVPVALGAWTAYFTYRLAAGVFSDRMAWWSLVLMSTTPLFAAGALLASPDAPMMLALTAASCYLHRALHSARTGHWLLTGVWAGVALLSKYTAVLWFASVLLWLVATRNRRWLTRWQPWAALGIALLLFAPVVAWNAQHHWISFAFQASHGLAPGQFPRWHGPAEYLVGQMLLAGPLTIAVLLGVIVSAARSWSAQPPDRQLLWCLAVVPFLAFLGASLVRYAEPNWPCFAYVPGVLLVTHAGLGEEGPASRRPRLWPWTWATNLAVLAAALIMVYVPSLPWSARADDFFGWKEVAARVDAAARARPDLLLAADRYQIAAELGFYTGRSVTSLNIRSRPNQFDLWRDDKALRGRSFLLIDTGPIERTKTADRFRSLTLIDRIRIPRGKRLGHDLFVYEAAGYRGAAAEAP